MCWFSLCTWVVTCFYPIGWFLSNISSLFLMLTVKEAWATNGPTSQPSNYCGIREQKRACGTISALAMMCPFWGIYLSRFCDGKSWQPLLSSSLGLHPNLPFLVEASTLRALQYIMVLFDLLMQNLSLIRRPQQRSACGPCVSSHSRPHIANNTRCQICMHSMHRHTHVTPIWALIC